MKWQRIAQLAIVAVVIVLVAAIAFSMRKQKTGQAQQAIPPPPPESGTELFNPKGATLTRFDGARKVFEAILGPHTTYPDGRVSVKGGARILTNRNGKDLVIASREADIKQKDQNLETATFRGDVTLTTADGLEVKSAEAAYSESEGIVRIPGAVDFKKGRTTGSGLGATYDRNRDVLWILDKARITVAPEPSGQGAMDASAATAGLARAEHYMKLSRDARVEGNGRTMLGDEITIALTPDDQRVQTIQLRGHSRITGGAAGPQAMTARDIDLVYAGDGRTLQTANLVEGAILDMGGSAAGKRISGRTINVGLSPDGATVSSLTANENVQVDIPADKDLPAKQIRSTALTASGPAGIGLQTATFTGKVEFHETLGGRRGGAAIDRTARSERMILETKPGLGAIEKADFRGNVKFVDAPDLTGEAQRGIYYLEKDRVELMPSDGDPGPPPLINDGKMSVGARTIDFTLRSRELNADTKVKSTLLVRKDRSGRGQQQTRVPSVLKQDEPVFVTSNRLAYQGTAATATYTGSVKLWQGSETTIKGDKIVLDDKNGDLAATGNVVTEMYLDETDTKTGEKRHTQTVGKSDNFVYDDAKRLAIYTSKAHINGPQGDITANKIELFLKPAGTNELERAEAYASGAEVVIVKEGVRTATGSHLTYTAVDQQYLMIGTPVTTVEEDPEKKGSCRVGTGSTLKFYRGPEQGQMDGNGIISSKTEMQPCSAVKR